MLANPVAVGRRTLRAEELAIHIQQVGPLVRPVVDEVRTADERVDQRIPLGTRVARVVQECSHGIDRGRQTGQIERHAAHELGVRAERRRLELQSLPLGGHQFVDAVEARRIFPDEPAAVAHHRERRGRVAALISRQDGRFAAPHGGHQASVSAVATSVLPLVTNASRVTSRGRPSAYVATTRICC